MILNYIIQSIHLQVKFAIGSEVAYYCSCLFTCSTSVVLPDERLLTVIARMLFLDNVYDFILLTYYNRLVWQTIELVFKMKKR